MNTDPSPLHIAPTFLVIGAARCGTTALTRALGQHPDVFITTPKEPHFFAFAGEPAHFTGPGDDEMINRSIVTSPTDYAVLFSRAGNTAHRGDGSVSTLYYHDRAVDNIVRYAPDAKLIVMLRDPVARAYSSYLYLRGRGWETSTTFEDGLRAEADRTKAGWHHMWRYRALGQYAAQLTPFIERLGRDRLHVIVHDDFASRPQETMRGVQAFLGLDPRPLDATSRVNEGGEARSSLVAHGIRRIRRHPTLRRAATRVTPDRWRERVRSRNLYKPPIRTETAGLLRSEYDDGIGALERLLDLDLSPWRLDADAER